MNKRMTLHIIGKMLGVEGLLLMIPMFVSVIYKEIYAVHFLETSILLFVIYFLIGRKAPKNSQITAREGMVIVASAWIFWSAFGALPFFLSGSIPHYIDAFFETVSGFTTTGSTILEEIESLPRGILFWRSLTHWVGGMGVLVFVMSIAKMDNKNSMHLMRAEVPGPEADKLVPKAQGTARWLYGMYMALTLTETAFLMFGGMSLYDALTHSFSTAGTGGFSTYNASIAAFDSVYIDGVITVFMILFGVNFNLYFFMLMGDFVSVIKNEELRAYFGIIATAIVILVANTTAYYGSIAKAFRYVSFTVGSVITTTGFITADFNLWPMLSKAILLMLMMIGASAGSTGGGMKVARFLILIKSIGCELKQMLHPKEIILVKVDGKKVKDETKRSVYVYFISYVMLLVASVLIVSLNNFDFETTFTSVLTTMNNIGPGLNLVGPVENFAKFTDLSKIVLSIDMLAGRLEIFPFLMLFSPTLWTKKF